MMITKICYMKKGHKKSRASVSQAGRLQLRTVNKAHLKAQVSLEVQVKTSVSSSSFHWSSAYWSLCCLATRQSEENRVKQNAVHPGSCGFLHYRHR